ncbi:hypothetical protein [Vibrio harveyi]|uniref:hypothetical protein n=1 Tax=Vibrio harveyi TaxID=669 RepID=UPI003CF75308
MNWNKVKDGIMFTAQEIEQHKEQLQRISEAAQKGKIDSLPIWIDLMKVKHGNYQ